MNQILVLLAFGPAFLDGQATKPAAPLTFMGRAIRMSHPATDREGIAVESASICLGAKIRQCFSPPVRKVPFGLNPSARIVELSTNRQAILFSATASAGGSGTSTLLALLEPGTGRNLRNLLPSALTVSNQSEYEFLSEPLVSTLPLLVVADYLLDQGETHFSEHRYRVTTYGFIEERGRYDLRDEFVTQKRYPGLDKAGRIAVIAHERREVLNRLKQKR